MNEEKLDLKTVKTVLGQPCTVFAYFTQTDVEFNADDRRGKLACYQLGARALEANLEVVVENATLKFYETSNVVREFLVSAGVTA